MNLINTLKNNKWLVIILVVSAFLRIFKLDFQSVWLDEVHTMIESNPELTFAEFDYIVYFREGMGHFYFLVVRLLQEVFGISSFVVRSFSAIMGIAAVYSIYALGKSLYSKNVGLIDELYKYPAFSISRSSTSRPTRLRSSA